MSRSTDSWHLREGDELAPELVAMRLLGGGSSFEAYLAFDEVTYAPVVVKVVRPSLVTSEPVLRGLRREVDALTTITHPVVVRALRYDLDGPRPHVVLEQIDGPRLSSLLRRHGALPEHQYLPLGIELASALHYLRRRGWTHLDVKPSNVIMAAPARLIDLSVARPLAQAQALLVPIGTDRYLAPEQCLPPRTGTPGHPSDVWGLAATLYEAVAGRRPFDDGDLDHPDVERRYPQLVADPHPLPATTPSEVAEVVLAGLARDPDARPLPHEVADALEPVLARQPPTRLTFKVR